MFELMISIQMIYKRGLYEKFMHISKYVNWDFKSLWMVFKLLVTSFNELTVMCTYRTKATMGWKGLHGESRRDNV